jgi:DNA helicase IV
MDKYVLHSDFYAMDMDEVDIVLGYPWIESMGTININVQKKNLKLWYKKNKITLKDVSLNKKDGPTEASKAVIVKFEFETEAKSIEGDEEKPLEGHSQEAKEVIDSKAQCVADLKKKEHIPTVVVCHDPHHIETQQSSKKEHDNQHIYAPTGNQKENQSREGAWRTPNTMGRDQAT